MDRLCKASFCRTMKAPWVLTQFHSAPRWAEQMKIRGLADWSESRKVRIIVLPGRNQVSMGARLPGYAFALGSDTHKLPRNVRKFFYPHYGHHYHRMHGLDRGPHKNMGDGSGPIHDYGSNDVINNPPLLFHSFGFHFHYLTSFLENKGEPDQKA